MVVASVFGEHVVSNHVSEGEELPWDVAGSLGDRPRDLRAQQVHGQGVPQDGSGEEEKDMRRDEIDLTMWMGMRRIVVRSWKESEALWASSVMEVAEMSQVFGTAAAQTLPNSTMMMPRVHPPCSRRRVAILHVHTAQRALSALVEVGLPVAPADQTS